FLNGTTEVQVATASTDPAGSAQAQAVAAYGARLRTAGLAPAPGLPELPERVPLADVAGARGEDLRPVLGLADLALAPAPVDLRRSNLIVVGPPRSGRSPVLATIARGLGLPEGPPGGDRGARPLLVALGAASSPLADLVGWDVAGFGRGRLKVALDEAVAALAGRDGPEVAAGVLLDAAEDLEVPDLAARRDALVGSEAVRAVAVVEPATLARSFSGWVAQLKTNRAVLHLQPASALEVEAVTA